MQKTLHQISIRLEAFGFFLKSLGSHKLITVVNKGQYSLRHLFLINIFCYWEILLLIIIKVETSIRKQCFFSTMFLPQSLEETITYRV